MAATPTTPTQRLSRQMQAAMHLKRRYELLFGKPISITSLRKDPEQLDAFRTEVLQSGDHELLQLFSDAFVVDGSDAPVPMWAPTAIQSRGYETPISPPPAIAARPTRVWIEGMRRRWPLVVAGLLAVAVLWANVPFKRRPAAQVPQETTPVAVAQPRMILRVHGSNTIGEKLAPMLTQAYLVQEGNADIHLREGANPVERTVLARES